MTMDTLWILLVGIALGLGIRWVAAGFDRDRIREYVESGGGKVLDIKWNPFGPGWFGSSERVYDVRYQTRDGQIHTSTCKTSAYSGVYWTGPTPPAGWAQGEKESSPATKD
jgi:hypothetical protein